jgi:hypothetical protein
MLDERAGVKTLRRPPAAPGRSAGGTLQDALVLERYRLLEQIGSGGHGSVWIARDERTRELVAVKRIPMRADDPDERQRIEREGRAAARLSHPAIVALYDSGEDLDACYLISELVEGASLARLYRERALADEEILAVGVALADALGHAHERGVVHRDVKPANVIVPSARRGAVAPPAKLTDFGIAAVAGEQELTRTGDVIGTLAYMAPEQAEGLPAGPPADLFSLALTLYEGLAGSNPLRGRTVAATARRVGASITPLERVRPDLPPALCAAFERALAPAAADRGTLADLCTALAQGDGPAIVASPRRAPRPSAPPVRRRHRPLPAEHARRLVGATLAGALCTVAVAAGTGGGLAVSVAIGVLAALGVAASPAVAWLVLGLGAIAWCGAAGDPGTALLLAAALAPVPLLLPACPWLWTAPALAPALGAIGLGAASPAAAGRLGSSWWQRAALAALSYWWLALAEILAGRRFLLGPPGAVGARASWHGSLSGAFDHVLVPLSSDGRLATAALWALAAALLPWFVSARDALQRAVGAVVWAGALVAGGVVIAGEAGAPRPPLPFACVALAAVVAYIGAPAGRPVHVAPDVA